MNLFPCLLAAHGHSRVQITDPTHGSEALSGDNLDKLACLKANSFPETFQPL